MNGNVPLALLAGGKGTRLEGIAAGIPKSMVEIGGAPFIEHQLRLLERVGVREVVILAGHLGEQIEVFVGNGSQFGLQVRYSYERKGLLGTGGAIKQALPLLGEQFWVLYGDSYLDIPFAPVFDFFKGRKEPALMTVFKNNDQWDRSNVEFENGRIVRYDKQAQTPGMVYIDYGLSLMRREAFSGWRGGDVFDLAGLFQSLANRKELAGYEIKKRFYEIGTPEGLDEMRTYLRTVA